MNVLHVYKTSIVDSIGGVEYFLDTLCNNTAAYGVNNVLLSLSPRPKKHPFMFARYQIVQAKQILLIASTGFSISAFAKMREQVQKADLVHYHFPNPFADILHFATRVKKPTLLTYHSDIVKQRTLKHLYYPLMHGFLKDMERIVATSPNYLASSPVLQTYKEKVEIISPGLDKAALAPVDPARLAYWRTRLPESFFLFVGTMRYYKGLHIALNAIKQANYGLVLAGDGKIKPDLQAQARHDRLENVYFIDQISDADKAALHHLSVGFVFPSHLRSEAFGIALMEAAAFGKPMISCDIGTGTSFVNIDGQTGRVVIPDSPQALRAAMDFLITDPDRAQKLGKNAARRYRQMFTADKQAQAYVTVYEQIRKARQ